jgi:ABC-type glycerol-3-phosphate transport system permease component
MSLPGSVRSSPRWSRRDREVWLVNVSLGLICLVLFIPIALNLLYTFEQEQDITRRWSLEGYERVFLVTPSPTSPLGFRLAGQLFTTYIPNTLLYASVSGMFVVALAGTSGFAVARYRFPGRNLLMAIILVLSGFPWMTDLLALYQVRTALARSLSFYDDRVFIVTVYTGFFLPLSVWIAKSFFDAIPRELEEAAVVDGCNPLGAFARITLPLAAPGMASVFLLTFVGVWNEFVAAYLLIGNNRYQTAMFGLSEFYGMALANPQILAVACVVVATPVVVVFLFARRLFFQGLLEGALKG